MQYDSYITNIHFGIINVEIKWLDLLIFILIGN
jgi:hypothetical protein